MKKRVVIAAIATTIASVSMVGCGQNNGSRVIEIAPGITVVETGNQGAFSMESDEFNPYGTVDFVDPMGAITPAASEEAYVPVAESIADSFNVKLADNQYIITANDKGEEAILLTALEGYKFEKRYSFNDAYLVNDNGASYLIYDCTGTLTKEALSEKKDIEDAGDGIYIENNAALRAYCFKDDVSMIITYANASDKDIDAEQVTANIKTLVKEANICK